MTSVGFMLRIMLSLVMLACLLAAPLGAQPALASTQRPHCEVCGRYTDKSPCRIRAAEKIGRHLLDIDVCSVLCYAERLEDLQGEIIALQVLDSTTVHDDVPLTLGAVKAVYLYGTTGNEEKTAKPFILAFANNKAAEEARKTVGGELMSWDDVLAKCVKLAKDYEPPQPGGSGPLRKRGRNPK